MQVDEQVTIAELGRRVADVLAVGYAGAKSGQVRAVPDVRTIRYYASIGLVDAPVAMRGRTALYGQRHFLQIVAVKRLQEQGKSLAEIQVALSGISNRALCQVAQVTLNEVQEPSLAPSSTGDRRSSGRGPGGTFWRDVPEDTTTGEGVPVPPASAEPMSAAVPHAQSLLEIELAPGVRLQIRRPSADESTAQSIDQPLPHPDDLQRVVEAATPLIKALIQSGLVSAKSS